MGRIRRLSQPRSGRHLERPTLGVERSDLRSRRYHSDVAGSDIDEMAVPHAQMIAAALAHEADVQLAVVFGSAARGAMHQRSDIDVAVIGPTSPARLAALAAGLSRCAGRQVDLTSIEAAPPLLRFEIARHGEVLVERRAHLWADFKARALIDWWDWAPHARRFAHSAATRLHAARADGP